MPVALTQFLSVICFSLPVLIIFYFQLYRHASLLALVAYYLLNILHCLNSASMPPSLDFRNGGDVLYNVIEIPLMLLALFFFCPAAQRQQRMQRLMRDFVVYEVVVLFVFGLTSKASLYIMMPGLLITVSYSVYLFLRQLKFTMMHRKNFGRVLMLGALAFAFSSYLFVFYTYFVLNLANITNLYAIHFVSINIAAVVLSLGLFMMRRRIKELQDLKIVRQEMHTVFGEKNWQPYAGCQLHQKSLLTYSEYLSLLIKCPAIFRRAFFVLKGCAFVKRRRPIKIMRCSSPSAKALMASLPFFKIRSAAS